MQLTKKPYTKPYIHIYSHTEVHAIAPASWSSRNPQTLTIPKKTETMLQNDRNVILLSPHGNDLLMQWFETAAWLAPRFPETTTDHENPDSARPLNLDPVFFLNDSQDKPRGRRRGFSVTVRREYASSIRYPCEPLLAQPRSFWVAPHATSTQSCIVRFALDAVGFTYLVSPAISHPNFECFALIN